MKRIWAIWLSIMVTFGSAFLIINVCENTEGKVVIPNGIEYVPHTPIRINGNGDFAAIATSGDGSPGTPWIIEGWDINGTGYGYCIYVGNTTEHYKVKDCYLHNASGPFSSGLKLVNSQNGTISSITAKNNRNGMIVTDTGVIRKDYSNNINITSNNISYTQFENLPLKWGWLKKVI